MRIPSLCFTLAVICCTAVYGDEPSTAKLHSFDFANGTYIFTVKPLTNDPTHASVTTTYHPKVANTLGSISEEASALTKVLDELQRKNLTVSHLYIPTTFQSEVIDRIQTAAVKSNTWRTRKILTAAPALVQMISESKAYEELRTVLAAKGLEIISISVENILTESLKTPKIEVPSSWNTFLILHKPSPINSSKPQK